MRYDLVPGTIFPDYREFSAEVRRRVVSQMLL
jgi:hypothetical protein